MIEQHPIAETGTISSFEQIVFGMITVFGRGNQIFFNFKNPRGKFKYAGRNEADVLAFAAKLKTMRIAAMRGPVGHQKSNATPLDLNVDLPSAIVLAVPNDSNMQFSATLPAITRKSDKTPDAYRNLRYIRFNDGGAPTLETKAFDGCKAVVFFSTKPSVQYQDGFNMHIDIVQQGPDGRRQVLPVLIDPDVRNPGGGGG